MTTSSDMGKPTTERIRAPQTRKPFARTKRLVLAAIAFLFCCSAAYRGGKLLANWRHPVDSATLRRTATTEQGLLSPVIPLAGIWSFDELNWSVRSDWIAASEVDTRFETLSIQPPAIAEDELPDSDPEFLTLAAALGVQSSQRDGNRVYRLARPGLKAQWITRNVSGRTKTSAFAVAYPGGGEEWQMFEFLPRFPKAENAQSVESHLLPLPAGARRSGGRFADDGQVLLEFVSVDATAEVLLRNWKEAGWEVRRNDIPDPDDFSYLAVRGDEVIYAWSSDAADALKSLMLIRAPADADTGL